MNILSPIILESKFLRKFVFLDPECAFDLFSPKIQALISLIHCDLIYHGGYNTQLILDQFPDYNSSLMTDLKKFPDSPDQDKAKEYFKNILKLKQREIVKAVEEYIAWVEENGQGYQVNKIDSGYLEMLKSPECFREEGQEQRRCTIS